MHVSWWKILLGLVMIGNGVFFASQVRLFHDAAQALRFHGDLPADVDPSFVDLKVVAWCLAGLAWIVAGFGLLTGRRDLLPAALVALLLVDGLFAVEFWLWGSAYPAVWIWFGTFGVLALFYATVCRQVWRSTRGLA
jgi:hypothetical protein